MTTAHIEKKILQEIRVKEPIAFVRELVKTPSENPPGRERECAETVARKFKEIELNAQIHEVEPDRPNVIGSISGGRTILCPSILLKRLPTFIFSRH